MEAEVPTWPEKGDDYEAILIAEPASDVPEQPPEYHQQIEEENPFQNTHGRDTTK